MASRQTSMGSHEPQTGDVTDIMCLGFGKMLLASFLKMEKHGLTDSLFKTEFYWLKNCTEHDYVSLKACF